MKYPEATPDLPARALAAVDLTAVSTLDLASPEVGLAIPHNAPEATQVVQDLVRPYPQKVLRKRAKHIVVNDPDAMARSRRTSARPRGSSRNAAAVTRAARVSSWAPSPTSSTSSTAPSGARTTRG